MRAEEKVKQAMLSDLIELSQNNPDKSKKIPAYNRLIQKIATELSPVDALENQAQQSTKGVTLDKNNNIDALKIEVGRLSSLTIGYAIEAEDVVLTADLTALKTKFHKATHKQFAAVCTEIVAEVRKLPEQWADFGITEAGVAAVETRIALLGVQAPKIKAIKTASKKAVKKRTAIFKGSSTTKRQILNIAVGFIGVDDEFYADIMEILSSKKRTPVTELVVVFKSSATQKLLADHNAHVVGRKATPKSNKKGEISFKFTQGGFKTVEVPLPSGEIRLFKDIEVPKGKTTTLIVEV
jgi:hypothetical protein